MLSRTRILGLLIASVLSSTSVLAGQTTTDGPAVRIRYGDLDLTTDAGARAMLERIHRASASVCRQAAADDIVLAAGMYQSCLQATVRTAITRLNAPIVTAKASDSRPTRTVMTALRAP